MKARKFLVSIFSFMLVLSAMSLGVFASDSTFVVSDQASLREALESGDVSHITIANNFEFTSEWIPVTISRTLTIDGDADGDGNGVTLSKLKVCDAIREPNFNAEPGDSDYCYYYAGLIGENKGNITIKNITFDGATVDASNAEFIEEHGSSSLAVLVGMNNSGTLICENVHIVNATVKGTQKLGAFTGQDEGTLSLKNCSVVDPTFNFIPYVVDGEASIAAQGSPISGYKKGILLIEDVEVSNPTFNLPDEITYYTADSGRVYYDDGDWSLAYAKYCYMAGYVMDGDEYLKITVNDEEQIEYGTNLEAVIGNKGYQTLEAAVAATNDTTDKIVLLDNIELNKTLVISDGKSISIDLNGYEICGTNTVIKVENASLDLVGEGKIIETDNAGYGALVLYGSDDPEAEDYTTVCVGKDVELSGWSGISIKQTTPNKNAYGVVVDVYGTLKGHVDGNGLVGSGMFINGQIKNTEGNYPVINIYSGANLSSEIGSGIYAAGYAEWNVEGATISGPSAAIGIKSGILNISGTASILCDGENTTPTEGWSNGINSSGAAIQIESNSDYAGNIEITISGDSKITSENGYSIYEYLADNINSTKVKSIKIEGGYFTGIISLSENLDKNSTARPVISGGHFTSNPTAFLATGKVAVASTEAGYSYTVADKNEEIEVETVLEIAEPVIENNAGVEISGDFHVDIEAAASSLLNDSSVIDSAEAVSAVENLDGYVSGDTIVTVVVQPYMDVKITKFESGDNKVLTVDITPKYNLIATIASGDEMKLDGADKNSVVLETGIEFDVTTSNGTIPSIEMVIPLPEGFATGLTQVYVSHKGHVYTASVESTASGDAAKFVNPHGFSEFGVSTSLEAAAQNGTDMYTTLAAAIEEVSNNDTITLLAPNGENIIVNKVVTFVLDMDGHEFSGDITAGLSVELEKTEDTTAGTVTYKFTEKQVITGGGGGGGVITYTVKFQTNGGTEIEKVKVNPKDKVAKPTAPVKEGYTFVGWYTDEDCTTAYDFNSEVKKSFTLYAKWAEDVVEWENPFTDVNDSHWFYEAVKYANEEGLFNGMSATEFGPDVSMTRAMLVTVLYRYVGEPEVTGESKFLDVVKGSYYEKAVMWAEANGIVNGMSATEFAPDNQITREQIVAIMFRFANYQGIDTSVGENTNILSYDDVEEVSEYAIPAMQWAVGSGVMKGKTESTLNPKVTATRAEVATILQRFIELNK